MARCARSNSPPTAGPGTRPTTRSSRASGRRSSAVCGEGCKRVEGRRSFVLLLLLLLQLGAEQVAHGPESLPRRHRLVHLPLVLAIIGGSLRALRRRAREAVAAAI